MRLMMIALGVNFIGPFDQEGFRLIGKCPTKVVSDWPHLGVHESVPEDRLLTNELGRDICKLREC